MGKKQERMNQTYFFSKLLTSETSLNVAFSGKLLHFLNFDLKCTKNNLFEQKDHNHHEQCTSLFYVLFRMFNMDKGISCTFEH